MLVTEGKHGLALLADSAPDASLCKLTLVGNIRSRDEQFERNKTRAKTWLGADTVDKFLDEYENGWPEGVKKLSEIVIDLQLNESESVKRRRIRSDTGDNLDIFRVYRGDLDQAWERCVRKHKVGNRLISLIVNTGSSYVTSADELFYSGATAVRLLEELEQAGYSVAVYGAISGIGGASDLYNKSASYVYKIKDHTDGIDENTMAVDLCRAGVFRHFGFAAVELMADMYGKVVSVGYGHSTSIQTEHLQYIGLAKNAIVISEAVLNEGSAKAVIEGVINYVNNVSTFDVVFVNKGGEVVEKALKVAEPDKVATLLPGSADVVSIR